jgi:hypothetical protein
MKIMCPNADQYWHLALRLMCARLSLNFDLALQFSVHTEYSLVSVADYHFDVSTMARQCIDLTTDLSEFLPQRALTDES